MIFALYYTVKHSLKQTSRYETLNNGYFHDFNLIIFILIIVLVHFITM